MDSKLRRMAVLSSMAVILLVSALVLYINSDRSAPRPPMPVATTEPPQESSQEDMDIPEGQIGNDLSAFLYDHTFFDQEVNPVLESAQENGTRLSLVVTSVERDLRIQVVDAHGNPVTGESFYVKLDRFGEYKDLDKDGIIYVGDLAAGEYYVELLPIEGYKVPVNPTRVRVKDRVEYVAIGDC